MNKSSHAMRLLLKIAKKELDLSAERLAKANRAIHEAKEQKDQLLFYRQDYVSKNGVNLTNGMNVSDLKNFKLFLGNIDAAINSQDLFLEQLQELALQKQHQWQSLEAKKRKYEILIEKNVQEIKIKENKTEQKLMDEFSVFQRRFVSK